MPYRILCNGTFQKSQKARSGLGLASSRRTSLHNNRYGVGPSPGTRKGLPVPQTGFHYIPSQMYQVFEPQAVLIDQVDTKTDITTGRPRGTLSLAVVL